jgi:low temperature requirement protein LtrA
MDNAFGYEGFLRQRACLLCMFLRFLINSSFSKKVLSMFVLFFLAFSIIQIIAPAIYRYTLPPHTHEHNTSVAPVPLQTLFTGVEFCLITAFTLIKYKYQDCNKVTAQSNNRLW